MWNKLEKIWEAKDLRNKILFVLAMLFAYRLIAHIPVPGVNTAALENLFSSNQALGLLNIFSGGGMRNFSLVLMGVGPYITSSIIFQLLAMIIPSMEEMQKEELGRQKINMWTRWMTIPLALLQSYGMISLLKNYLTQVSTFDIVSIMITTTASTIFLMWLGELISEKKIGNGVSMIIFAGIVAKLPQDILQTFSVYDSSKLFVLITFVIVAIITVIGIVFINEGQRNIPIQHARQIRGNRTLGGSTTHLPIRVNMGGVIPIIFAISVILFPEMIAQFFRNANTPWIAKTAEWVISAWSNQLIYGIMYFVLVFAFTYFYTEVIFHPDRIAENLQKQGAFIPGIRPGQHTQEYLNNTAYKVIFAGALFLSLIAVLPLIIKGVTQISSLAIGGTSILIVVAVVIDMVKQIESQLTMREYEGM
jgi:preprotein translocase subunit SecY